MANAEDEKFSEILADKISTKLIRWAGRTIIGLTLFGVMCFYFNWPHWLFWSYLAVSLITLFFILYSFCRMMKRLKWAAKFEKDE